MFVPHLKETLPKKEGKVQRKFHFGDVQSFHATACLIRDHGNPHPSVWLSEHGGQHNTATHSCRLSLTAICNGVLKGWSYRRLGGSRGKAAVAVVDVVEFRVRISGCSVGFLLGWPVHLSVFGTFPHRLPCTMVPALSLRTLVPGTLSRSGGSLTACAAEHALIRATVGLVLTCGQRRRMFKCFHLIHQWSKMDKHVHKGRLVAANRRGDNLAKGGH